MNRSIPWSSPRIALLHDWLTGMRGAEKVLEVLCELWPDAEIFTLLVDRTKLSPLLRSRRIHASVLQALPGISRYYRHLLPLMPAAALTLDTRGFDLLLSGHHCVVKSVPRPSGVPHLCYCHTPMRYAWHMRDAYLERANPRLRPLMEFLLDRLKDWDQRTARRVTHFLANSQTIRQRVWEAYRREATVLYPPVDTEFFTPSKVRREDYYLVVSALVPYKRVDLAVAACRELGRPLVVIGSGEERARLQAQAGSLTTFAGWQSNEAIRDHLRRCRALLFPGEEDFGIVPLEASACGTPVLCFARGGATETIIPAEDRLRRAPTGLWFNYQNTEALVDSIQRFERGAFISPHACRAQAERFARPRFEREVRTLVEQVLSGRPLHLEGWDQLPRMQQAA